VNDLGVKYLGVRLAPEEHEALQSKAKAAGVSLQQYVRELVTRQLDEKQQPLYPKTREWHDLLEYVLQNDKKAAESLKVSLRLMVEAIESRKGRTRARRARGA